MSIKGIAWAMTTATLVTWLGVAIANEAEISALLARKAAVLDEAQVSRLGGAVAIPDAEFAGRRG